jgi:hypothetical protein
VENVACNCTFIQGLPPNPGGGKGSKKDFLNFFFKVFILILLLIKQLTKDVISE